MDEVSPSEKPVKVFIKSSLFFNAEKVKWVTNFAVWKPTLAVFWGKSRLALGVGSLQSRGI